MGVTGLWRLIEPAGKPVPVETLENKVLAVDISIWLHQMVKGYQDAKGAPLPNAHLMGLFQRLCKLLYFRIKPVFVFDGGFPDLKKETIAKRQDNKSKYNSESERLKRELALLLGKKTAVSTLLGKQISPKKGNIAADSNDDIFKLPALPQTEEEEIASESEDEENSSGSLVDLHSVDIESENFKTMPVKEKYELLIELKETRKMNSWGKLHELPKKSDSFSDFQMQRLLKRKKVQECLQETEKEMGDTGMSLIELESLLNEEGIDTKMENLPTRRIASNDTTRFLLINNVKQALAEAKKKKELEINPGPSKIGVENSTEEIIPSKKDELEDDLEKAIKMSLECVCEPDTSTTNTDTKTDDSWTSVLTDSDYTDSEEEDGCEQPDNFASAKAYIMQYSDFTHKAINKLVGQKGYSDKIKSKVPKVNEILEELNNEKSLIADTVDLSSNEEDDIETLKKGFTEVENLSIDDLDTSSEDPKKPNNVQEIKSVVFIENTEQDIISLDTSTEENSMRLNVENTGDYKIKINVSPEENIKQIKIANSVLNRNSDKDSAESESGDDFEEVPEVDNESDKPIVELTLNIGDAPEDDIFADIFTNKQKEGGEHIKVASEILSTSLNTDIQNQEYKNKESIEETYLKLNESVKLTVLQEKEDIAKKIATANVANSNQELEIMNVQESIKKTHPKQSEKTDLIDNQSKPDQEIMKKELKKAPKEVISTEKLNSMVEELQNEEQNLLQEKSRLDRIGRNITEQMTKEAQELLQIFGVPYIVAPMEAEAQCAFLETVKLTDGTITDDSDIWLFGGRTVYKNFFNQKKHVLQFLADRIERSFNLTREQLVLLALLVGSDYTTGLTGVGPVTAMEILASFPFNKKRNLDETSKQAQYSQIVAGLHEFKQWVRAGKRTDNTTLKKKLKNVKVTHDFPSVRVVEAYLEPFVEKSDEKFSWGELDVTVLRDYTKAKFGWSQNKLDEILKPVLKRMLDRKSQRTVQDYFKRKVEFQPLDEQMSKRVKAAVQRMGPELPLEQNAPMEEKIKTTRKRKINKNKTDIDEVENTGAAGPSKAKHKQTVEDSILCDHGVKVLSEMQEGKSSIEINIPKSERYQEIIPQREKDKQSLLQNKMKAIEVFRKTKIDRKRKTTKRKVNLPKEKADLSESSDST